MCVGIQKFLENDKLSLTRIPHRPQADFLYRYMYKYMNDVPTRQQLIRVILFDFVLFVQSDFVDHVIIRSILQLNKYLYEVELVAAR